jgi:hypothetical protein
MVAIGVIIELLQLIPKVGDDMFISVVHSLSIGQLESSAEVSLMLVSCQP